MQLHFIKVSPTQNTTILVQDPVPRSDQPGIAARLLANDSVGGEQVGFIEPVRMPGAQARLQMMGGEFCGNATMSLGSCLARENGLKDGASQVFSLEISGAASPVCCEIERRGDDYRGTVDMPLPDGFAACMLPTDQGPLELPVVILPGIAHGILSADLGVTAGEIERRIRDWSKIVGADALGVLLYEEKSLRMRPIVYVPATDSAVWERGCGSGTAALGCWKAHSEGQNFSGRIRQPGGIIEVRADAGHGEIERLSITGNVHIAAEGIAYL